jgi:tetratricopeptide (TPR) repeat protein
MRRASISVILVLTVLLPTAVHAQGGDSPKVRALQLFEKSREHYRAGRFKVAAELLREAYRLQPEPILLFNLARALEGGGELEGAIEAYEEFLKSERAVPDRGAIEQRVATMRRLLEERRALETRTATRPEPLPPTGVPAGPTGSPGPRPRRPVPWILTGIGVATLATGGVFGGLALERHDAAKSDPIQASAASAQNTAKRYATVATVLFAAGGAVTAAGVIWLIAQYASRERKAARASGIGVALGPGALVIVGTF